MQLDDELFEIGKNSKGICTIVNDDYVLVSKTMPVTDDKLTWYIEALKQCKNDGINIATIVDYRLIPEKCSTYGEGISYTKGVFLEERAKGVSLDSNSLHLSTKEDYNFNDVVVEYLRRIDYYISELERRAQASQEVYDKLVSDMLGFIKHGLMVDPKPLNFFYREDVGFNIIDVIPANQNEDEMEFFPNYVFGILYSYGLPQLAINWEDLGIMPSAYQERMNKSKLLINAKTVNTLRKFNFSEEKIQEQVATNIRRANLGVKIAIPIEDMEDYVASRFKAVKEQEQRQKNNKGRSFGYSVDIGDC